MAPVHQFQPAPGLPAMRARSLVQPAKQQRPRPIVISVVVTPWLVYTHWFGLFQKRHKPASLIVVAPSLGSSSMSWK